MTAKGKINASNVQTDHRIIVWVRPVAENPNFITESPTKTGEGRQIVRVLNKVKATGRRGYVIITSAGQFYAEPIQTMWLAPEDAAGIKRAYAEALVEDVRREVQTEVLDKYHAEALAEDAERTEKAQRLELAAHVARRSGREELTEDEAIAAIRQATDAPRNVKIVESVTDEEVPAPPSPEEHTGSTVIRLLERVWERIREDKPELPQVVIVTGSGEGAKWGHFRADSWKVQAEGAATRQHELFLASEALAKGAHQVLQTMLHEAAHTLAKVRGQQDTSRQGRWHNQTFRKTAEEMGLTHPASQADKSHGFAFVKLTEATKARYADLLVELSKEIQLTGHLPGWLGGSDEDERGGERMTGKPAGEDEEKPKSGNVKAVCGCDEPLIIRLSKKVLELRAVCCERCGHCFKAA